MKMTVLYGIPNCDTVKKARVWLQEHGVEYEFSDFKKQPPTEGDIRAWLADVPLDTLLNRRGTTWRKLSEAERAAADSEDGAVRLMCAQPSLIKRPVLEHQGRVHIGFSPERYSEIFA